MKKRDWQAYHNHDKNSPFPKNLWFLAAIFVILGVLLSFFTRYFCAKLCGTCFLNRGYPCDFLFLFVSIILIISGTSLVLTSKEKIKNSKKK